MFWKVVEMVRSFRCISFVSLFVWHLIIFGNTRSPRSAVSNYQEEGQIIIAKQEIRNFSRKEPRPCQEKRLAFNSYYVYLLQNRIIYDTRISNKIEIYEMKICAL